MISPNDDVVRLVDNNSSIPAQNLLAAIDLGSNSFHMVIAQLIHGEIRLLEKRGEKVQLAAGLNKDKTLNSESQERALDCLKRFAQRIEGMPKRSVWVVGTNTLRIAKNAKSFIHKAEKILGHKIEIVSGREEARLIYLGVSHSLPDSEQNRLVIDIGGGSTEFILGRKFDALVRESMHMGCVSYRDKYFPGGKISVSSFSKAVVEASLDLVAVRNQYIDEGWTECVGSSGTIKAISLAMEHAGYGNGEITKEGLQALQRSVIELGHIDHLSQLGVRKERHSVFPSGLAILTAAFEVFDISHMVISESAMREGLLYEMVGPTPHVNVQQRTLNGILKRYLVDEEHAQSVALTATKLWQQVAEDWSIPSAEYKALLHWAGLLHEIGLAISHSQFHKHGAYLIRYSDLAGFSKQNQQALAILIRFHRRKVNQELFNEYCLEDCENLKKLTILLRLAVLLQRPRNHEVPQDIKVSAKEQAIHVQFADNWLTEHSLISADLDAEKKYLEKFGIELLFE